MTGIEGFAESLFRPILEAAGRLPLPGVEYDFYRVQLLAVLMVTPMCAALGTQVVAFRMAFFSDAVAHSVYTGVALGIIAFGAGVSLGVTLGMVVVGVLVGLVVAALRERTRQTPDTLIAIVLYGSVTLGLTVVAVSSNKGLAATMAPYLFGAGVAMSSQDLLILVILAAVVLCFQVWGFNRLMLIGLNPVLATTRGIRTGFWNHAFATVLALVVTGSVRTIGVLVVGALLIVPAAAARNVARSIGGMFWWSLIFALVSGLAGMQISYVLETPPLGASVVLVAVAIYALSELWRALRRA